MSKKINNNTFNPYYSFNKNNPQCYNLIDWSAVNSEKEFNKFKDNYLNSYNCWDNKKIYKTNLEINNLFLKHIEIISKKLNEHYKLKLPKKFWFNINIEWVHILISYTIQKYYEIEYFSKYFEDINFEVLLYKNSVVPDISYPIEITNGLNDDLFDIIITNIIFRYKKFNNLNDLNFSKISSEFKLRNKEVDKKKNIFYLKDILKKIKKNIKFLLFKRFQGVYKFNKIQQILISFYLTFYISKKNNFNSKNYFEKIKKINVNNENMELILSEVLEIFFPKEIKNINFNSLSKKKYYKNKLRIIHTDIQTFDRNLENSYAEFMGEKIINVQHGSNYGSSKILDRNHLYEYSRYCFLTWGWNVSENNPTNFYPINIPKPIYKYKKFNKKFKFFFINSINLSKKSLFVGSSTRSFTFFINLRLKKLILFNNLSNMSKKILYFKDHFNNSLFSEIDFLVKKKLICNIATTKNFNKTILKKSNLIILPCYDTVLYESLHFNIPTLLLDNNELFDQFFIKDYELLKKANVVFENPLKLAERINYFTYDTNRIDEWWNNKETKKLINEFVSRRIKSTNMLSMSFIKNL